jgi:hypothetical protein
MPTGRWLAADRADSRVKKMSSGCSIKVDPRTRAELFYLY